MIQILRPHQQQVESVYHPPPVNERAIPRLFAYPHNSNNIALLQHRKQIPAPGSSTPVNPLDTPPTIWAHDGELFARPWGPQHKPNRLSRRGRTSHDYSELEDTFRPPYIANVPKLYGQRTSHLLEGPLSARGPRPTESMLAVLAGAPRSRRGSLTDRSRRSSINSSGSRSPRDSFTQSWETTSSTFFRPYTPAEMVRAAPRRPSLTLSEYSAYASRRTSILV
jgi:hypothetical protein